ncbi:unnamed protein product, partial [Effrenium voratum]
RCSAWRPQVSLTGRCLGLGEVATLCEELWVHGAALGQVRRLLAGQPGAGALHTKEELQRRRQGGAVPHPTPLLEPGKAPAARALAVWLLYSLRRGGRSFCHQGWIRACSK